MNRKQQQNRLLMMPPQPYPQ